MCTGGTVIIINSAVTFLFLMYTGSTVVLFITTVLLTVYLLLMITVPSVC